MHLPGTDLGKVLSWSRLLAVAGVVVIRDGLVCPDRPRPLGIAAAVRALWMPLASDRQQYLLSSVAAAVAARVDTRVGTQ